MSAIVAKLLFFWLARPVLVVVFGWDIVRWRRLLSRGQRVRGTTNAPRRRRDLAALVVWLVGIESLRCLVVPGL